MARYGIVMANNRVFGVSMESMRGLVKRLGRDHALAAGLWKAGWHETRILAAFVEEPGRVTPAQMDRWARAFDNWAICDGCCFHLFDKTPHAWAKVEAWSTREEEFVRRAAFALLASLSVHDKACADAPFVRGLALCEAAATDPRNFVKKAVNWALRSIGKRNLALHGSALDLARRLAASTDRTARWIGRDASRELESPAVLTRLTTRARRCEAAACAMWRRLPGTTRHASETGSRTARRLD
jgi:3-methyladenine DNA glycosylase AlkD